jgi:hypothetical protein
MDKKLNFKQVMIAAGIAAGVSTLLNAILFFVGQAAGILTNDIMIQPNQSLTVIPVVIASILPTLIAGIVFFMLEKYSKNGFKIFSYISIILMILSFSNPFVGIPNVTVAYGVVLCIMHVVVAFSILFFIRSAKI